MFADNFKGKTVWVSGHTGFKGAWLCEWLLLLGARVHGFALAPPTEPALFDQLALAGRIDRHEIADVRNPDLVSDSLARSQPDFVFHLAAQSLVRRSYEAAVETFATNVMGTVHVIDGLRRIQSPCAAVMVTTDKVYENREWIHGYREEDRIGGHDPYSASKAASEIAIASFRRSFFSADDSPVKVASARAGNVIGGGDWAKDRIIPDCIRTHRLGESAAVRAPGSTRPWQHVLEPLSGYLTLAAALASPGTTNLEMSSAFNFGPDLDSNRSVAELVSEICDHTKGSWHDASDPNAPHEANRLNLNPDKAFHLLGWKGRWPFERTVAETVNWYALEESGYDVGEATRDQIRAYQTLN